MGCTRGQETDLQQGGNLLLSQRRSSRRGASTENIHPISSYHRFSCSQGHRIFWNLSQLSMTEGHQFIIGPQKDKQQFALGLIPSTNFASLACFMDWVWSLFVWPLPKSKVISCKSVTNFTSLLIVWSFKAINTNNMQVPVFWKKKKSILFFSLAALC